MTALPKTQPEPSTSAPSTPTSPRHRACLPYSNSLLPIPGLLLLSRPSHWMVGLLPIPPGLPCIRETKQLMRAWIASAPLHLVNGYQMTTTSTGELDRHEVGPYAVAKSKRVRRAENPTVLPEPPRHSRRGFLSDSGPDEIATGPRQ